jgi:spore maturation protein CgeD
MQKVSCILTSYNRPRGVREAIASVQAQTYPNWELIIVDDHSNEETLSVLMEIVGQDRRCRLLQTGVKDEDRSKTTRYATCINMALKYITGDLVTYLTDDDIYYPQRFEKMLELFNSDPNIHVVYGRQKMVHIENGVAGHQGVRPLVGITRHPMGAVDHNSFMHRRYCLELVKGWDDNPSLWPHADLSFFQKLAEYWEFYPVDFITDEHRFHGKSVQAKFLRNETIWDNDRE